MDVVWDPQKGRSNYAKHGVSFSDAEPALYDPAGVTFEDTADRGEERLITIGLDALGQIVVVVYTHREADIRIISARRATTRERAQYAEGIRL